MSTSLTSKRVKFKKLISALLVVSVALLIGLMASSYYIINAFTTRPVYTRERVDEHERNRRILLEQHNALPIKLIAEDGINLAGFLLVRPQAQHAVLICHGYRMSKERMLEFVHMFPQDTILLFDYRAHGQSEGLYTTIGFEEKKDVVAAIKFLQAHEHTKHLPIVGIGVSMGAVSLLGAAVQLPVFKGLILDSPFARLDKQVQKTLSERYKIPLFAFERIGSVLFHYLMHFSLAEVNALLWAEQIATPVLIVHSEKDEIALFQDAVTMYEKIKSDKQLWAVASSGHARIFKDCVEEYQEKIHSFIQNIPV